MTLLIPHKAVDGGLQIPDQLHTYEEAYTMRWRKTHGYKIVVGNKVYCLHYKPPENRQLQNGIAQAIVEFKCGLLYSHFLNTHFSTQSSFFTGACSFH
jgi:hypothetical protein